MSPAMESAAQNQKTSRKRVQAKTGEVLTEPSTAERLRLEEESRKQKKAKGAKPKVVKTAPKVMKTAPKKASRRALFNATTADSAATTADSTATTADSAATTADSSAGTSAASSVASSAASSAGTSATTAGSAATTEVFSTLETAKNDSDSESEIVPPKRGKRRRRLQEVLSEDSGDDERLMKVPQKPKPMVGPTIGQERSAVRKIFDKLISAEDHLIRIDFEDEKFDWFMQLE